MICAPVDAGEVYGWIRSAEYHGNPVKNCHLLRAVRHLRP